METWTLSIALDATCPDIYTQSAVHESSVQAGSIIIIIINTLIMSIIIIIIILMP